MIQQGYTSRMVSIQVTASFSCVRLAYGWCLEVLHNNVLLVYTDIHEQRAGRMSGGKGRVESTGVSTV